MENNQGKDNYSNLNRNTKWLGIIDYKSIIILLIIAAIMWNILGAFIPDLMYRAYILFIILIPFLGLIYANKSNENISNIIYMVLRYLVSPKLYIYNIECNDCWLK